MYESGQTQRITQKRKEKRKKKKDLSQTGKPGGGWVF